MVRFSSTQVMASGFLVWEWMCSVFMLLWNLGIHPFFPFFLVIERACHSGIHTSFCWDDGPAFWECGMFYDYSMDWWFINSQIWILTFCCLLTMQWLLYFTLVDFPFLFPSFQLQLQCELDIMFHLEKAHFMLEEMVMNGCIVETSKSNILTPVQLMDKTS